MVQSTPAQIETNEHQRYHYHLQGTVQGVGFRPYVYRLANEMGIKGWVSNTSRGVFLEAEGPALKLKLFEQRLLAELPPHSQLTHVHREAIPLCCDAEFIIQTSDSGESKSAIMMPDLATCPECRAEILDSNNRRYLYPFTNCTHCGPRYSIIEGLPYDRPYTTMRAFDMCGACREEYENPMDRRFHAQPNACPECGPHLELWSPSAEIIASHQGALQQAAQFIRMGMILAVKGLGGFHLMVDAENESAVHRLRERKQRWGKPLALMIPNLESAKSLCRCTEIEEELLTSPQAPIVLLPRKENTPIAASVSPGNPHLGLMLPYTPLHILFMNDLSRPVVATSGNLSEEPICIDNQEAIQRLNGIADYFLVHNRPIARPVDDSVVRVVMNRPLLIRRSRGYAPLPITHDTGLPNILSAGGHLKNTAAITAGYNIFLSQHIGDLENQETFNAFESVIQLLQRTYDSKPELIAHDSHPDYISTQYAQKSGIPCLPVQHHYAHVLSCMADNQLQGTVLGVSWDGTGYGTDGDIWGGEFLLADEHSFERVAHLQAFPLLCGEKAIKDIRLIALGLLYSLFGEEAFSINCPALQTFTDNELRTYKQLLHKQINCPSTTSAGRLFDAAASLIGLRHSVEYEGQAAMEMEWAIDSNETSSYPFTIQQADNASNTIIQIKDTINAILLDLKSQTSTAAISARFHKTLIECIVKICNQVGEKRVVLTGGCFQNAYLLEHSVRQLRHQGFEAYWHRRVPPNDGGLSLGQTIAAIAHIKQTRSASCV